MNTELTTGTTYNYNGLQVTVGWLAKVAGCTVQAMQTRLKHMDCEQAVKLKNKLSPMPSTYIYKGKVYNTAQLAQIAGISIDAMASRLVMYTAEQAVAMGKTHGEPKYKERFAYRGAQYTVAEIAKLECVNKNKLDQALDVCPSVKEAIRMCREGAND